MSDPAKDLSGDRRAYVEAVSRVVKKHIDAKNADLIARIDSLEAAFRRFDQGLFTKEMGGELGKITREILAGHRERMDEMERTLAIILDAPEIATKT